MDTWILTHPPQCGHWRTVTSSSWWDSCLHRVWHEWLEAADFPSSCLSVWHDTSAVLVWASPALSSSPLLWAPGGRGRDGNLETRVSSCPHLAPRASTDDPSCCVSQKCPRQHQKAVEAGVPGESFLPPQTQMSMKPEGRGENCRAVRCYASLASKPLSLP